VRTLAALASTKTFRVVLDDLSAYEFDVVFR